MRHGAITHTDGVRLAEAADQAVAARYPPRLLRRLERGRGPRRRRRAPRVGPRRRRHRALQRSGSPCITAATGPVVSGPALLLGLSDLVVMSSEAVAFVSGPQMVAEFTGIVIGIGELGGAAVHATASGLCAVRVRRRRRRCGRAPRVPAVQHRRGPAAGPCQRLGSPPHTRAPRRDPRTQGGHLRCARGGAVDSDDGGLGELWPRWAAQLVAASPNRGRPIGSWPISPGPGGHPRHRGLPEGARFVRLCDAFNLPSSAWSTRRGPCPARTSSGEA